MKEHKKVRELFQQARKQTPAVIFVDEIDAVGGKRSSGDGEAKDQNSTLNLWKMLFL
ncbi:AAA family ATPase ['Camptotheca acuminata' phytoplasma]|uniref:AAA family ATPase n=1 Tax='Camptotheca acuminata' phytoplasma TaxID=3239192 RepID=UPI00351A4FBA